MREFFDRIFVSGTSSHRVLFAVWSSTPFFIMILLGHGWALTRDDIRASLHLPSMWAIQALMVLCILVNLGSAWAVWARRAERTRVDGASLLVCLSIGLGYTVITVLAGSYTTGATLILIGVLAIGLLLFPMRIMVMAYIACAVVLLGHDAGVLLKAWSYAPALGQGMFVRDEPVWWFAFWRGYVFYAGFVVLMFLLMVLFRRLDEMHASLTQLSNTDELTGLANRRRFMACLHDELSRQGRSGQPLCVALLDADHFKRVNDRHGHHAGDEVLRTLGAVMLGSVRAPTDVPARLGGEEFALLMPQTRLADAQRVCERLRATVAAQRFRHGEAAYGVTISIGLVESLGDEAEAILAAADRELYRAKAEGRNRVRSRARVREAS